MKTRDVIYRVISYAAVFSLGYYLGGGCEYDEKRDEKIQMYEKRVSDVEKDLGENKERINNLEGIMGINSGGSR